MTAKLRPHLSYPNVASSIAILAALAALILALTAGDDDASPPQPRSQPDGTARAPSGSAFVVANPDVNFVNEDGITQVSSDPVASRDRGTYIVTAAVRVNDSDGSTGDDTLIDCRILRNPDGELVDGRSVRLVDTGVLDAPLQSIIALNGTIELSEGDRIDIICAQEGETGNVEATVDSARLVYARVAP